MPVRLASAPGQVATTVRPKSHSMALDSPLQKISIECRDHEQERKNKVKKTGFKSLKMGARCISVAVLPLIVLLGTLGEVKADEADAKLMIKAMSDYMAGEKAISFAYDSIFEVATTDHQTIGLASS